MVRSSFPRMTIVLQTICGFSSSSPGCSLRTKPINDSSSQLSFVSCNFSRSLSACLLTYHLIYCPWMTPSISACLLLISPYRLGLIYLHILRRGIFCFYRVSAGLSLWLGCRCSAWRSLCLSVVSVVFVLGRSTIDARLCRSVRVR